MQNAARTTDRRRTVIFDSTTIALQLDTPTLFGSGKTFFDRNDGTVSMAFGDVQATGMKDYFF